MRVLALFVLVLVASTHANVFNVVDFGAVGDGKTLDTASITKAILAVADAGWGTVLFPPGVYLTAPINLTNNIVLLVQSGATILGSQDASLWPVIEPLPSYGVSRDTGSSMRYQALIYAYQVNNVTLTGGGTINGQGSIWWDWFRNNTLKWGRGRLVELQFVKHVVVTDLTLTMSPFWTLHPVYCDDVIIRNVTILNPMDGPNTDGIDPDSSSNVYISDSYVEAGDDNIAIKSGIDWCGREFGMPTVNVTIENVRFGHGLGLAIGSEMSGDVYNIVFRNLYMNGTQYGPKLKTMRGRGGYVTNVTYENIRVNNLEQGIFVNMFYGSAQPTNKTATPVFSNFQFINISGTAGSAGQFTCLPESPCTGQKVVDVNFSNKPSAYTCSEASGTYSECTPTPSCL